jgi:hypothetical protein
VGVLPMKAGGVRVTRWTHALPVAMVETSHRLGVHMHHTSLGCPLTKLDSCPIWRGQYTMR